MHKSDTSAGAGATMTSSGRGHVCLKSPVEVVAGNESATIALTQCDGSPAPLAVDELSILARPGGTPKPKQSLDSLARSHGSELAPGIRRLDARLVEHLELVAEHFAQTSRNAQNAQNDAQVAAVVNYLRTHFGNDYRDAALPKDVGVARR